MSKNLIFSIALFAVLITGIVVYLRFEILPPKPEIPEIKPEIPEIKPLPVEFDWRNTHGKNYMTSVKNQSYEWGYCGKSVVGNCATFSSIGMFEAIVNAYYNSPINVDLSEFASDECYPDILFGSTGAGIGLLEEVCLQECIQDDTLSKSCGGIKLCDDWQKKIWKYQNNKGLMVDNYSSDYIKKLIINFGPAKAEVYSLNHGMVLTGWKKDNTRKELWIFKDSQGTNATRGNDGYQYLPLNTDFTLYPIVPRSDDIFPILPPENRQLTIDCQDNDGDGYLNWGLAGEMPEECKNLSKKSKLKDCDDSNSSIKGFNYCNLKTEDLVGNVKIESNPNGSRVRMRTGDNWIEYGITPVTIENLTTQTYILLLGEGYSEANEHRINVLPGVSNEYEFEVAPTIGKKSKN